MADQQMIQAALARQQALKDAYMAHVTQPGNQPIATAFTPTGAQFTNAGAGNGGIGGVQTLGDSISPQRHSTSMQLPAAAVQQALAAQPSQPARPSGMPAGMSPAEYLMYGAAGAPAPQAPPASSGGQPYVTPPAQAGGQAGGSPDMSQLMANLMHIFQNGQGAGSQFTTSALANLYGAHGVTPGSNFATSGSPVNYLGLFSQSDPFWGQNIGAQMPATRSPANAYPYPEASQWGNFRDNIYALAGAIRNPTRTSGGTSGGAEIGSAGWETDQYGRPLDPNNPLHQGAAESGAGSYQEWLGSITGAGGE